MRTVSLTAEQLKAVELGTGAHLVTAPPGSGKTEVLVQRVIHLLDRSPGDLFRILALTYTVKAARELEERVRQVVPDRDLWRVSAVTFHSFGLGILQNYGKPVGLKPPVTVISDLEDKRLLVLPLLAYPKDSFNPLRAVDRRKWKELFDEIARRKTNLETPEEVNNLWVLDGQVSLSDAYEAYEEALVTSGSVDYEGMIYQTVRLIGIDPWVGGHIRRQYRHILVDEGQELTRGQYQLLKAIRDDTSHNVFVVADTYQSINSFAGGGPTFLREFVSDFEADESHLTTNFRSAQHIVTALDLLRQRIGAASQLAPKRQKGLAPGWIEALSHSDEQSEAEAVSSWIRLLLQDGLDTSWVYEGESTKVALEDVCILGRTRYAFGAVVTALEGHGVPVVQRIEQGALFESRLARRCYEALKLVENPANLPARRRLDELGDWELQHSTDLREPVNVRSFLQSFADSGALPGGFVDSLVRSNDVSINRLHIVTRLIQLDPSLEHDEMEAWHRDQQLLQQLLTRYEVGRSVSSRSLGGFLRMLTRLEDTPLSAQAVRVLTPYRARGLAFKVVVILGMNEGTFPYYRATHADELNEERRVVYVAASRAARALLLTRPRERKSRYGTRYPCQESRFIGEMGLAMNDVYRSSDPTSSGGSGRGGRSRWKAPPPA